ncbi:MAG: hypothetical protein A4E71_02865 [Smithella sp. PtaU1.Bin162]|nr:MAG: hypothetical protein A4E71_02865 [Smithella sp. PtaU1.Bin162]
MADMSRRSFFHDYFFKNAMSVLTEAQKGYSAVKSELQEACAETKNDLNYFDSFESAYPLISESAYFLDDEVARLKIDTTGMTQLEIVKEIYRRNKQHNNDDT